MTATTTLRDEHILDNDNATLELPQISTMYHHGLLDHRQTATMLPPLNTLAAGIPNSATTARSTKKRSKEPFLKSLLWPTSKRRSSGAPSAAVNSSYAGFPASAATSEDVYGGSYYYQTFYDEEMVSGMSWMDYAQMRFPLH